MRIITTYIHAIEALATTSAYSLNHAMLHTSYENAINLTHTLYSSKNLTDQFDMLAAKKEDLIRK
jgi:hypothetical protein